MQIPGGMLLDRFSPRLIITLASATCAFGALWMTFAHGFMPAFAGRFLIGLGSSFGFVSLMIVTLNWFPKKYFAPLIGVGQFVGALGPLAAGAPIALLFRYLQGNWRIIFLGVALFGGILTFLIGLFLRDKPRSHSAIIFVDRQASLGKRLRSLFAIKQIWAVMIYGATVYVTMPLLGAFWGTSYLIARGHTPASSALIVSMIWLGLAIGSPLFSKLSEVMKRRKPILAFCGGVGVVASMLILLSGSSNNYYLGLLFLLVGLASAGQNLSFAIITEHAPKSLKATALGINNTAIMGLAAILPPFVTSIIQFFTHGEHPSLAAYTMGFSVIPVVYGIALFVAIFGLKETFCRHQKEILQIKRPH